ncbi:nucleoside 2-deoxyribosyltransferase [Acetilactobacillus jinshanensis]|uniref:Nucleoside 2-deoxyribosyltransferase n=1 Tax=Acetilactobacillus jinshanensis TaxID=1720083 RepID=A0A4P6ZLC9_9LACO|nr:nucleoside 2-deoxyribosyltransferase [Acetilactobacillus jinshanensis]QBP18337.1 nucleoside 2-deoxyribosyltransferase [Acetilactobacillus jinshanensis]URL61202.1 nucleoside 2-deoxyribosyltransferase [uncultured bacterium]
MVRVFISAPFFSDNQVNKVKTLEWALKKNPTVDSFYSARLEQGTNSEPGSLQWGKEIYHRDMNGLKSSDVVVAILDFDGHDIDSGTSYEIGQAKALGKPVIALRTDRSKTNLMIGASADASFNSIKPLVDYDFNHVKPNAFKGQLC